MRRLASLAGPALAGFRALEADRTRACVARLLACIGPVSHSFDLDLTSPSPQLPLLRSMIR